MARLFITLYLGIIATGFVLLMITSSITDDVELEYDRHDSRTEILGFVYVFNTLSQYVDKRTLTTHINQTAMLGEHRIIELEPGHPALTDNIRQQIADHTVAITGLENDEDATFWFQLDNGMLFKVERDQQLTLIDEPAWLEQLILWALLAAPAVAIFLWLASLQYKLSRLERAALAIAAGDLSQRAPTDFGSRVGSLNISFNQMAETNEQLLASHKRLTNAVAHELRSPLFRIRCQLDMLHEPDAGRRRTRTLLPWCQ